MDKKPSISIKFYEFGIVIHLVKETGGLEITINTNNNTIHNTYLSRAQALRIADFIKESFQDKDTPICINEGNIGKRTI